MIREVWRWLGRVAAFSLCLGLLAGCGQRSVDLAGTVERKTLELAAPTSEVLVALPVAVGERVEPGQVVVQLDTEVSEAELRAHQAALEAAQAALTEAEGVFVRQSNLQRSKVVSKQTLDGARRGRDEAVAAVREREARIAQAVKRLEDLTIRSHSGGVVDQLPFETGERAPAGGVVAVVLGAQPWVRVWMPARAMARVKVGDEAEVKVTGLDGKITGRISFLSLEPAFTPHYALTERESAYLVYETRVDLVDAPPDLRPGLPARVHLRLRKSTG